MDRLSIGPHHHDKQLASLLVLSPMTKEWANINHRSSAIFAGGLRLLYMWRK